MALHRRVTTLMLVALVAACEQKSPYTFGVVLDTDGERGAGLAVEEINAHGGIDGHILRLHSVGGAASTEARVALQTAAILAADPNVIAVIGHTNSSASLSASQVYNAEGVVQIAPNSSTPLYSMAGRYSFRLTGSDEHQGVFLANHVLAMSPRPRTAVLFVNDDYGRPLRDVVVARLEVGGLEPVYDSPYSERETDTDIAEMIEALARSRPDVLIWVGRSLEFVRIQPVLTKALPKLVVLASDGFAGSALARDSLHALDGVRYVRLMDPNRKDPRLDSLYARYRREGWPTPTDQAVLSYDAVLVLADAVRAAGRRREAVRTWLARVGADLPPIQGLSGPIAFSAEGDRLPQYFLETIGESRLRPAHPSP